MKHYLSPTNQIFAYELDGSQDHLIPENFTEITDSQANDIREQINQDYLNSLTYAEKRVSEYPTIGDQLDALYHAGVFPAEMDAILRAVKEKYPK